MAEIRGCMFIVLMVLTAFIIKAEGGHKDVYDNCQYNFECKKGLFCLRSSNKDAVAIGVCHNDRSTTLENEILISKWRTWYKSMDVNHDERISIEDVVETEKRFSDLQHLGKEEVIIVKESFAKWWDECVFQGKTGTILEQAFVDSLFTDFKADQNKFRNAMDKCFDLVFSAADINEDKSISEKELLIAFAAYGHQHIAKDNDYFSAYNPKDGLVPLRVIVDSWVDFVTSTDAAKGNIVEIVFKVDGYL